MRRLVWKRRSGRNWDFRRRNDPSASCRTETAPTGIYEGATCARSSNRMSGSYERVNYITSFGFSLRGLRQVVASLPAADGQVRILDIMTGMGEVWPALRRRFPHGEYTVLDFSEGMLHYSRRRNQQHFSDSVHRACRYFQESTGIGKLQRGGVLLWTEDTSRRRCEDMGMGSGAAAKTRRKLCVHRGVIAATAIAARALPLLP